MKKYLYLLLVPLLLSGCSWKSVPSLADKSAMVEAVELDADSNGGVDINKGGTNATTEAGARTALGVPATADTLVGDCTVGPCLDGSTDGGNMIKLWAGTGSYWTALQGGAPAANRSWRLPIDAPPSAGTTRLMNMDEYGQMGFVDPATFATPTGSAASMTVVATGFDGNLATTDNTIQEIAQKLDDLNVSGSMTWPTGAAGTIPVYGGSSNWGTSYSLTTLAAALDGENWTFTGAVDMSGASSVSMGPISFEGATANDYETTFSITDPTADRTITVGNFDSEIPAATAVDSSGNILVAGIVDSTTEALGLGSIELGHASDTTIARSAAGAITVEGVGVSMNSTSATHTAGTIELGAASDTTIARSGAGAITVEGVGVVTTSSSDTLTNKTLSVEGTGNAITIVDKVWFAAAGCNNTTATSFYDLPASNPAAAACITGTNTQKGVLDFDAATDESGQVSLALPSDWSGNIDLKYKWLAAATSGSVVWGVQTSCVADAETDDPSWNTASTVTDAAKGTTVQTNDASMTSITVTGCAAGELMHLRFFRDADNGSDDMTGDARLIGAELTLRRAQ